MQPWSVKLVKLLARAADVGQIWQNCHSSASGCQAPKQNGTLRRAIATVSCPEVFGKVPRRGFFRSSPGPRCFARLRWNTCEFL